MLQMQNPINAPQGTFKATKDPIFLPLYELVCLFLMQQLTA